MIIFHPVVIKLSSLMETYRIKMGSLNNFIVLLICELGYIVPRLSSD